MDKTFNCWAGAARTVCLLRIPSTAQSLTFPRSGSGWAHPMLPLLYALLATARSSLKPQRELALGVRHAFKDAPEPRQREPPSMEGKSSPSGG